MEERFLPVDASLKTASAVASELELPEGFVPLPGTLLLSTRAISNRCNDNGDFFSRSELLGSFDGREAHNDEFGYRTFVGKPVFCDHNNTIYDDPRGRIIASHIFHDDSSKKAVQYVPDTETEDDDTWVKNYFEVDADRYPLTASAIKLGFIKSTSMGCDIEYSLCSVCGNKALFTHDYCDHVANHKMRKKFARDDGVEVLAYEKNYGLVFFEDSLLTVPPADPTADILEVKAHKVDVTAEEILTESSSDKIGNELSRQPILS